MTEISSLKPNSNATIEATIIEISPPREVTTQRGPGRVADATLKDDSGSIVFTLWNEDVSKFKVGQKIKITDGWVKDFKGKLQIATGRSGSVQVLSETP
jgi:replication factor A1